MSVKWGTLKGLLVVLVIKIWVPSTHSPCNVMQHTPHPHDFPPTLHYLVWTGTWGNYSKTADILAAAVIDFDLGVLCLIQNYIRLFWACKYGKILHSSQLLTCFKLCFQKAASVVCAQTKMSTDILLILSYLPALLQWNVW
jgi:hypothetical protein